MVEVDITEPEINPKLISNKLIQFRSSITKIIIYLAMLTLLAGCRFFKKIGMQSGSSTQSEASGKKSLVLMPKVLDTDLNSSGSKLYSAGFIVKVKREKVVVKKSGQELIVLPEIIQTFQPGRWNHMIAAQEPDAGTSVSSGTVVILTAGMHHGAGAFRPWIDSHKIALIYIGENRCRECHTKKYCLDCHTKVEKVL